MRRRVLAVLFAATAVAAVTTAAPSAGQVTAPAAGGESTAVESTPAPTARAGGLAYAGSGAAPVNLPGEGPAEGATSPLSGGESVIGVDNRTRVTPTNGYPSSAIGQIELVQNGGGGTCTGWLIDPNTIVTSGHCVADGFGSWTTSLDFFPGRDRAIDTFGGCSATELWTTAQWFNNGNAEHDFGLAQLDCNVGNTVGWFGYRSLSNAQLQGRAITVRGYPGDAPVFGEMQTMDDAIRALVNQSVRYRADTFGGQSGSPVFEDSGCGGPCGLAVHSYGCPNPGAGCPPPGNFNSGPRLTAARVDTIYDYAAENDPHPDALIRRSTGSFVGGNRYNRSGAGQSLNTPNLPAGVTRNFVMRIQNDGVANDTLTVRGRGSSPNFIVRYFVGPTNVTAQVNAGTFQLVDLGPAASVDLRVEVKVKNTAPGNAKLTVRLTTTSAATPGYQDVVRTTVAR